LRGRIFDLEQRNAAVGQNFPGFPLAAKREGHVNDLFHNNIQKPLEIIAEPGEKERTNCEN
jgi:hypothetical protein